MALEYVQYQTLSIFHFSLITFIVNKWQPTDWCECSTQTLLI